MKTIRHILVLAVIALTLAACMPQSQVKDNEVVLPAIRMQVETHPQLTFLGRVEDRVYRPDGTAYDKTAYIFGSIGAEGVLSQAVIVGWLETLQQYRWVPFLSEKKSDIEFGMHAGSRNFYTQVGKGVIGAATLEFLQESGYFARSCYFRYTSGEVTGPIYDSVLRVTYLEGLDAGRCSGWTSLPGLSQQDRDLYGRLKRNALNSYRWNESGAFQGIEPALAPADGGARIPFDEGYLADEDVRFMTRYASYVRD